MVDFNEENSTLKNACNLIVNRLEEWRWSTQNHRDDIQTFLAKQAPRAGWIREIDQYKVCLVSHFSCLSK